jgi:uncharacterized repeat protein (TIGR01451 family)
LIAASSAMTVPAFAAEWDITDTDTFFGSVISNTASLSYDIGGENFTEDSNDVTFKVDRKIIFSLTNDHSGSTNETVAIGEEATTIYTLTNNSNAPIDYLLPEITNTNSTYTYTRPGTSTVVVVSNTSPLSDRIISLTVGDNSASGNDEIEITVDMVVPATKTNGDTFDTSLSIVAIERTATGTPADPQLGTVQTPIIPTSAATEWVANTIQTVAITEWINADNEIERSDTQEFTVQTAIISLKKSVRVIFDPVTGAIDVANNINPRAIPGATIEYTLTVINQGPASASGITLNDTVVSQLTVNETGFTPVYTVSGTSIQPNDTSDSPSNANLTISGQTLTFSNVSIAADSNTTDNADPDNTTDGKTEIIFTVKLK